MASLISKAVLDDIRFRCDIADVIDAYLTLPRKGQMIKILCPFHKEKTPSFHVNRQRQTFHCFGCGAGGDVFKFVMLYEKVDFPTSVRILAEKAGITLEFDAHSGPVEDKNLLITIHEEAAALFRKTLQQGPMAKAAREYLERRKLEGDIAEEFMIGYAPDQWEFLVGWARQRKFPLAKLELAGLILKRDQGRGGSDYFDRFRNRVMFPIRNELGRIVGFSGRTLSQDPTVAKYVNSPESPIFRKSHLLYALDRARREIADAHEAIVCEGQIDVIRCHQAGFRTAVAAQGTAFTEDHARILKRYADGAVLVFDGDTAGTKAAIKTGRILLSTGLSVRVAALPSGEDPDSFLLKQGAGAFRQALTDAGSIIAFHLQAMQRAENPDSPIGMTRMTASLFETVAASPSPILRDSMIEEIARLTLRDVLVLKREFQRARTPTPAARDSASPAPAPVAIPHHELMLAEHLQANPALAPLIEQYLPLSMIGHPLCRRFIEAVIDSQRDGLDLMEHIATQDDADRTLSAFAARIFSTPPKIGADADHRAAIEGLILAFWRAELQRRREAAERQTLSAREGDERDALLAQAAQLTTDLKRMARWESGEPVMHLYCQTQSP